MYDCTRHYIDARVYKDRVGVCGLITPWSWPLNQTACKVAPALAAGCTMVLKPSDIAPVGATLLAEVRKAAADVARRLRTGMVHINGASLDAQAPFGGYRQSGNGRERVARGIEEFLELKAVMGA